MARDRGLARLVNASTLGFGLVLVAMTAINFKDFLKSSAGVTIMPAPKDFDHGLMGCGNMYRDLFQDARWRICLLPYKHDDECQFKYVFAAADEGDGTTVAEPMKR